MKKAFLVPVSLVFNARRQIAFICKTCISLILLSSCHNSISGDDGMNFNMSETNNTLYTFARQQNVLMGNLLKTTEINSIKNENDSIEKEEIINAIKRNVNSLNEIEKNAIRTPAEEFVPSLAGYTCIDPDSLPVLIKGKTSHAFYSIFKKIIEQGKIDMSENEIIDNKNLSFKEKTIILLALPVLRNNYKYSVFTRSGDNCLSRYKSSRRRCGTVYIASCALAFTSGPLLASAGIALATYELDNCLNDALQHYKECQ